MANNTPTEQVVNRRTGSFARVAWRNYRVCWSSHEVVRAGHLDDDGAVTINNSDLRLQTTDYKLLIHSLYNTHSSLFILNTTETSGIFLY